MALRRFSTSGITAGTKSSKVWDGETFPGYFESIATVVVPSANQATVTFSNIPQIYTHLQLRIIARGTFSSSDDNLDGRFNGDTGSNYAWHILYGGGSSAGATASSSTNYFMPGRMTYSSSSANTYGVSVTDILDYTNTNKYKTVRSITGQDQNGSGIILLNSGLWQSTSAITSIDLFPHAGGNFVQYSHFALYGIRSA